MTTRLIIAAFALAFGFNYSQAADIVLSIQSQADQTKTISWNSEPGALYRIESAESFSPQPQDFPNRWTVREVELPSQGASTVWMDVGDAGWIPRLFHPRLNTQRFYQVIQVGEATLAAPTVTVEVLQNGTVVPPGTAIRGDLEIRWTVDLGASGDLLSDVLVFVDGQVMTRGATLTGSRFINTTEWPNGEHRIWASAKTLESADTTSDDDNQSVSSGVGVGGSSVTTVTFDNYISKFFVATPYFDPAVQGVQEIVAEFKEDSFWQCFVVTGSGSPVVGYQGQGTSLYVAWDGTDGAGNEVPDGVYDYLIEAHPTALGPFGGGAAMAMAAESPPTAGDGEQLAQPTRDLRPSPAVLAERAERLRKSGTAATDVFFPPRQKSVLLADRNPRPLKTKPAAQVVSDEPAYLQIIPPPLRKNVAFVLSVSNAFAQAEMTRRAHLEARAALAVQQAAMGEAEADGPAPAPDPGQTTGGPNRIPGTPFKGFIGAVGTGYQGHHPSWQDIGFFSMPSGTSGHTSRKAPYGKLRNAGAIANGFAGALTSGGWRRAFDYADDGFKWWHLSGCYTGDCDREHNPPVLFGGSFGRGCHFGLLVGHMIGVDNSPFAASHSYYPFWNPPPPVPGGMPRSYDWIALPEMDFGQSVSILGGNPPLLWMGLYGCNSLRINDVNDLWTKFLLPFPENVRVLLGSDTAVYIHPAMGSTFGNNVTGSGNPANAMSIIDAWNNAGGVAHRAAATTRNSFKRPGTTRLTAVFRTSDGFSDSTYPDTIYSFSPFIDPDWALIDWESQQVYP